MGFFPFHVLTCLPTEKGFLKTTKKKPNQSTKKKKKTTKPPSELTCVCGKSFSYQFFNQNLSFFTKFLNLIKVLLSKYMYKEHSSSTIVDKTNVGVFYLENQTLRFLPPPQDDAHLFNQQRCYMSSLSTLNFALIKQGYREDDAKVEQQCKIVLAFFSSFSYSSPTTPQLGQENVWSSCHGRLICKYSFENEYITLFIATVNNNQDRTTCAVAGIGIQCQSSV